jgi:hypothetical protein
VAVIFELRFFNAFSNQGKPASRSQITATTNPRPNITMTSTGTPNGHFSPVIAPNGTHTFTFTIAAPAQTWNSTGNNNGVGNRSFRINFDIVATQQVD